MMRNGKKGAILITLFVLVILIILTWLLVIMVQYFLINNTLSDIRVNLFYIVQNALMAYSSELNLDVYNISSSTLSEIIVELINKNHVENNKNIKKINIQEIGLCDGMGQCFEHTDSNMNVPYIHIKLKVDFLPIINLRNINLSYGIHEDIKLSLMEY